MLHTWRTWVVALTGLALSVGGCSCGESSGAGTGGANDAGGSTNDAGDRMVDASTLRPDAPRHDRSAPPGPTFESELWYSVDDLLVRVVLSEDDGAVIEFRVSHIVGGLEVGQNAITMIDDGGLLGARLSESDQRSHFYFIAEPPRDGSDVTPTLLGVMPEDIMIEGLYSDCDGRAYAMDTGADDSSSTGNRLLRFTGDVLSGDFSFVVVSDLGSAVVADIDDMSPGINGNQITDNPGLAIDTGDIYDFNYETGTGTRVGNGGSWGIHALGGELFSDGHSRLFVLSSDAELFEVDPETFMLSDVLGTGPTPARGVAGWSGLAGPLTECDTGFTLI